MCQHNNIKLANAIQVLLEAVKLVLYDQIEIVLEDYLYIVINNFYLFSLWLYIIIFLLTTLYTDSGSQPFLICHFRYYNMHSKYVIIIIYCRVEFWVLNLKRRQCYYKKQQCKEK